MDRTQGKKILYFDYSNFTNEQLLEFMKKEVGIVKNQPVGSVLYIGNYTNIHFSVNLVSSINKLAHDYSHFLSFRLILFSVLQLVLWIHQITQHLIYSRINDFTKCIIPI